MIMVSILPDGSVGYYCSRCGTMEIVDVRLTKSPFWGEWNGYAILKMLGHFDVKHSVREGGSGRHGKGASGGQR